MRERTTIKDRSGDGKYFVQIPRLVWALSRSPYDYMLWSVIKDIAGDQGTFECRLSTRDLAAIAMMSTGKVVDSRSYLMDAGLIEGRIEKDDLGQATWHLTIPDVMEENVKFSKSVLKLKERAKYKLNQIDTFRKERSRDEHLKRSPDERSVHGMNASVHGVNAPPYREEFKEEPKEEPTSKAPFLEAQNQKPEKPNAEPLPTETRSDCAAPAPIGGMREDSERPEPSVAGAGVGEDRPSWVRYVAAYYNTRDEHSILKHLKAADKVSELTGDKVSSWCARCGTLQEWLRSNVDGTYAGKTNGRGHSNGFSGNGHSQKSAEVKRLEPVATESKRPAPPVTSADRTREFFFDKVIPLDIQVHGKQTLWYNSTEHPKVFAMAWQCYWPEEEILKRLPRYWRSTNDFYRKAGYNLRLFFQNFDEFADQLTKTEMRYPMLSDVYAAQEQAAARNEA